MATKTDLRVVLGVDGEAKFSATMKNLAAQQKTIRAETANATSALQASGTEYEKAQVKAEGLTKQINIQEQKVELLREAYEKSAEKKGEDANVTLDLKKQYEDASAKLNNMKTSLDKANTAMIEHAEQAEKASTKLKQFGEDAEFVGGKLESVGGKMSKYMTTGILAAGGAAAKAAIDYEQAFAGVEKTVDGTREQLDALSDSILDMSTELPESAVSIAGVAESAGQLGIAVDDIGEFSEVMVKLGMSTNVSAQDATDALGKLTNITKTSSDEYENMGSAIVALGNNFASTESEIIEMATRLAATGEIIGLSEQQMLGIATALSSVGIEAEAGGTAISKLLKQLDTSVQTYTTANATIQKTGMSLRELEMMASHDSSGFKDVAASLGLTTKELKQMMSNAKSLEQFSDVAGMTADEFIQAYGQDSVAALGMFIDGLNDTERTGKNAVEILQDMGITEVRLSNAVLALASSGGILTDAVNTSNSAWEENNALQKEVDKRLETTGTKMTLAKNELQKTAIIMGDNFLPTIAEVASTVGDLAKRFGELDDDTKKTTVRFALCVAAAGPVISTLGKLTTTVGKASKAASTLIKTTQAVKAGTYTGPLSNLLSVLTKTNTATGNLAGSSSALAGIMGSSGPLVIGLVAAAGAALGLYAAYRKLTEGDRAVTEGVESMLSAFGQWDETVENATNLLSNLNTEIIVSSEQSAKISQEVDDVQKDITQIATTAAQERRRLTDEEIQRLEDLFAKLNELTDQEIKYQQAYQDAVTTIAQTTTDYSRENCADLIKSAQEARDSTIALAADQQREKLMLLQQAYEVEGTLTEEEYNRKVEEANREHARAVQAAEDKFAEVNSIVTQGYFEQNIKGNEHLQNIIALNDQLTASQQAYTDEVNRIMSDQTMTETQKLTAQAQAWWNHYWETKDIQEQMDDAMENLSSEELDAWINMSANTEYYGGEITDENKEIFDEFIGTYDNLPRKAKKLFRDTMQGMIDGIKEKNPELFNEADKTAGGFIYTIRRKFDSRSPSRVMKKVFRDVMDGGVIGTQEKEGELSDEAESAAASFLEPFEDLPSNLKKSVDGQLSALRLKMNGLQMQVAFAGTAAAASKGCTYNSVTRNQSSTNYDQSAHFEALLKVENLTVRNDADLRKISGQLEALSQRIWRGKGIKR